MNYSGYIESLDRVFSVTSWVRLYGARFTSGKEGICSESVRNVGTSSAVLPQRKEPEGSWGLAELEESK